MAMTGKYGPIYAFYVFPQILHFGTIFLWQTISGSIGNVKYGCTSFDGRFTDTRQKLIIRSSCIFCIEFHVLNESFGIGYSIYGTFDNFILGGVELVFNV